MPILYALLSRGGHVLCEVTAEGVEGDYATLTRILLRRLPPSVPCASPHPSSSSYQAYAYDQLVFHSIQLLDLIALCVTDRPFPRDIAFACLSQLHSILLTLPPHSPRHAHPPSPSSSSSFSSSASVSPPSSPSSSHPPPSSSSPSSSAATYQPSLSSLISHFNALAPPPAPPDTVVAASLVHCIDRVVARGERIELLVQKVETMEDRGIRFQPLHGASSHSARRASKREVERNARIAAVLCVFVGAVGYVALTVGCGGFNLHNCV